MTDTIPVPREELEKIRDALAEKWSADPTCPCSKCRVIRGLDRILNTKTDDPMPFDQSPTELRPYVRSDTARANLHRLADVVERSETFDMNDGDECIIGLALRHSIPLYDSVGMSIKPLIAPDAPWQTAPAAAAELRRLAEERVQ